MTWRAFFIGLLGVVALSLLSPYAYLVRGSTPLADYHLPVGAFFLLVLLTVGLNVLIKLVRRGWALRRGEVMLVWCMLIAASTVPESGLYRYFYTYLGAPAYYAQREDYRWEETVLRFTPEKLILRGEGQEGEAAVRRLFEGTPPGVRTRYFLPAWAGPFVAWGGYVLLMWLSMFCTFGLLRKQWVENERLPFPLARIPMELAEGCGEDALLPRIMRSRLFWVGAIVAVVIMGIQAFPPLAGLGEGVRFRVPFQRILRGTPLEAMSLRTGEFHLLIIGIAFLLPAEISLSIWLWWFLMHGLFLVYHRAGLVTNVPWTHWVPYMRWQQAGFFIVVGLVLLWKARRHLLMVARVGLGRTGDYDDSAELIPYRLNFWGWILTFFGLLAWSWWFGLNPLMALAVIGLNFLVLIVQTRAVVQGGIIATVTNFTVPSLLTGLGGGFAFSARGATVAYMQDNVAMYGIRGHISHQAAHASKIGESVGGRRKLLFPAMLVAMLVAVVVAGWMVLHIFYSTGALNTANTWGAQNMPVSRYRSLHQVISAPGAASRSYPGFLAGGALAMGAFMFLHWRFYWWPLHWLGLVVANNGFMDSFWLSFLVAWMVKMAILKLAGGRAFRRARTLILGMTMAAMFLIGLFACIAILTGRDVGSLFLPG